MKFWNTFLKNTTNNQSDLEKKLKEQFPHFSESALVKLTCISGLLASIAYNDFEITDDERLIIKSSLKMWVALSESEVETISNISINYAKDFASLENQIFINGLNEILDKDEKYHLVESLFAVAASDGDTSIDESEQIKSIVKLLGLSREHYTSARAKVVETLNILK